MPKWLHRTNKHFLQSVASADLPEAKSNYIEEPDLSSVLGQPSKYWVVSGDIVSLMSQSEMDAVDVAELSTQRDAMAGQLDQIENVLRAFALAVLDEFNILRAQHGLPARTISQLKQAVRSKLGN